jgi:hypothetical protein
VVSVVWPQGYNRFIVLHIVTGGMLIWAADSKFDLAFKRDLMFVKFGLMAFL